VQAGEVLDRCLRLPGWGVLIDAERRELFGQTTGAFPGSPGVIARAIFSSSIPERSRESPFVRQGCAATEQLAIHAMGELHDRGHGRSKLRAIDGHVRYYVSPESWCRWRSARRPAADVEHLAGYLG
jgi:hypothetical protein